MSNPESGRTVPPEYTIQQLMRSNRRKHIFATLGLLLFATTVVGFLVRGIMVNPNRIPSALLGKPAKEFNADWLNGRDLIDGAGNQITLESLRGKPLILNFWASWCGSCRDEAVYFEKFWQKEKLNGINVVGIAIQDTVEDATRFAQRYGKTYILGLDVTGKASIDYGVYGVPETFFIDRNGIIVHKEAGPVDEKMLVTYLELIR